MSSGFSNKPNAAIRPADNFLRRKIGSAAMSEIFTLEKIEACQRRVDESMSESLQEMQTQVTTLGEEYMKASKDPAYAAAALTKGNELAFFIKRRMETLNFIFGYRVAESLYNYTKATAIFTPDVLLVVCKHVAVLNIIIHQRITGAGGAMEAELLANLKTLIAKTRK